MAKLSPTLVPLPVSQALLTERRRLRALEGTRSGHRTTRRYRASSSGPLSGRGLCNGRASANRGRQRPQK
eukprot:12655746-Prorocentrum_lima.AAC.1